MIFFKLDNHSQKDWDLFNIKHKNGSIHQVSAWKKFQATIPGRELVLGFGVRDSKTKQILATVLCVKMDTGKLNKFWFYSARGPVFDQDKHKEAGDFLIQKTAEILKEQGAFFWRIDPYFNQDTKTVFQNINTLTITDAIQAYQPENTLEIDLALSVEDIFKDMKRKGRYNIKQALKNKVTIKSYIKDEISAELLDEFIILNEETTKRDGFASQNKNYYHQFLAKLPQYAVLFFAIYEGKKVAAAISTFCGTKAIYYFGASSSDLTYRKTMAPYLLQWEMIQYAKEKGCLTYDFLGIAPTSQLYKEGFDLKHTYAGITQFKTRFGGYRVTYGKAAEIILNKFWYRLYLLLKKLK